MRWLNELFADPQEKGTISKKNKEQINRLVMIAALENRIEPSDINLIIKQLNFVTYEELPNKQQQIWHYKKSLPKTSREKFKLIFLLVTAVMTNGALSEKQEKMLTRIVQVLHLHKEKSKELISFIKVNIRNGLTIEGSYLRLGYLLEKPRYT